MAKSQLTKVYSSRREIQTYAILPNIRSAYNVGSVFRTADGAGVEKIYLCGYSPTPAGTGNRKQEIKNKVSADKITKTALGAEKAIPWEYHKQPLRLLKKLKKEGVYIVALEQSPASIDFRRFKPPKKRHIALMVGNEVSGLPKKLLEYADATIHIPMLGKKESLNVAVAFGIAAYQLRETECKK